MKRKRTILEKVIGTTFLVGTGVTGTLFFVWLISLLLKAIF